MHAKAAYKIPGWGWVLRQLLPKDLPAPCWRVLEVVQAGVGVTAAVAAAGAQRPGLWTWQLQNGADSCCCCCCYCCPLPRNAWPAGRGRAVKVSGTIARLMVLCPLGVDAVGPVKQAQLSEAGPVKQGQ